MWLRHPEEPTPLNAPGPFYVVRDECIACHAPEAEAPELMAFDETAGTCYFHRQPQTPEETEHAIQAVVVACCDAVQYRGTDPIILKRFVELRASGPDSPLESEG